MTTDETSVLVTAALAGDASAFTALTERHRRELHVHCYRMLASFDEADDAVQETFLRAWRRRDTLGGDALFRAWLYRIATNVCLDMIRSRSRRMPVAHSYAEVRGCSRTPTGCWTRSPRPTSNPTRSSSRGTPWSWRSSRRCRCCRHGSVRR